MSCAVRRPCTFKVPTVKWGSVFLPFGSVGWVPVSREETTGMGGAGGVGLPASVVSSGWVIELGWGESVCLRPEESPGCVALPWVHSGAKLAGCFGAESVLGGVSEGEGFLFGELWSVLPKKSVILVDWDLPARFSRSVFWCSLLMCSVRRFWRWAIWAPVRGISVPLGGMGGAVMVPAGFAVDRELALIVVWGWELGWGTELFRTSLGP